MPPKLTKADAITAAKSFRQRLDALLQEMKEYKDAMINTNHGASSHIYLGCTPEEREARNRAGAAFPDDQFSDHFESVAQTILSLRDLESSIMRLGLVLKHIGNPDPYPASKDPTSTVVEPTADGLKM